MASHFSECLCDALRTSRACVSTLKTSRDVSNFSLGGDMPREVFHMIHTMHNVSAFFVTFESILFELYVVMQRWARNYSVMVMQQSRGSMQLIHAIALRNRLCHQGATVFVGHSTYECANNLDEVGSCSTKPNICACMYQLYLQIIL